NPPRSKLPLWLQTPLPCPIYHCCVIAQPRRRDRQEPPMQTSRRRSRYCPRLVRRKWRRPQSRSDPAPAAAGSIESRLLWRRLRVSGGAAKFDFANVAGRWVVVEKDNYPVAPAKLLGLLDGLADLTLVEPDASRSADLDLDAAAAGEPALIALRGRAGNILAE